MKLTKEKIKRAEEWLDCQAVDAEIDETLHALADAYERVVELYNSLDEMSRDHFSESTFKSELRRALEGK